MEGKEEKGGGATAAALVARFEASATEATAVEVLAQIEILAKDKGANHFLGGPMAREAVNKLAKKKKEQMRGEWTAVVAKALGAVLGALATMCDHCDQLPAAHFCQDCDEYLCVPCNDRHGKHRKKKDHVVRALADMRAADLPAAPKAKCAEHPAMDLSVWCDTHRELMCSECLVGQTHRACEYDAVAAAAAKYRPEVVATMRRAADQIAVLEAAKEKVQRVQAELNERVVTIQGELRARFAAIVEAARRHEQELIDECCERSTKKTRVLVAQVQDLQRSIRVAKASSDQIESALERMEAMPGEFLKQQRLRGDIIEHAHPVLEPASLAPQENSRLNVVDDIDIAKFAHVSCCIVDDQIELSHRCKMAAVEAVANTQFKKLNAKVDMDKVDDVRDDLEDALDMQNEISEALGGAIGNQDGLDEDDLLAELEVEFAAGQEGEAARNELEALMAVVPGHALPVQGQAVAASAAMGGEYGAEGVGCV
jgi:hypothetical protein